jgi:hypothetical protein
MEVNELLVDPDGVEVVRDQVAGILALELENQYAIARKMPDLQSPEDYNVRVYIENDEPWAVQDERNPFPAINVSFDRYMIDTDDGTNGRIITASYDIDCYAAGNYTGQGFAGRRAKLKSLKTARFARNILQAGNYRYLGLRGTVNFQHIKSCTSGIVKDDKGAVKIGVQRIVLEVEFHETSPQVQGVDLDVLGINIRKDTGEVLLDIEEKYKED